MNMSSLLQKRVADQEQWIYNTELFLARVVAKRLLQLTVFFPWKNLQEPKEVEVLVEEIVDHASWLRGLVVDRCRKVDVFCSVLFIM